MSQTNSSDEDYLAINVSGIYPVNGNRSHFANNGGLQPNESSTSIDKNFASAAAEYFK